MDFSKLIVERRSVRKTKGTPIQPEVIVALLNEAAALFEAEGEAQWRCICYSSLEARKQLADSIIAKVKDSMLGKLIPSKMMELYTNQVVHMPALLTFIAEAAPDQRQSDINYAAVCSIMQNVQLLGWKSGLGMLWYTESIVHTPSFYQEIGLQSGERFAGLLNMGFFDKAPRARKRTPAEQKWTEIAADVALHAGTAPHSLSSRTLLEMLNIAVWAPNDGLREPWRFIYVTEKEAVARLHGSAGHAPTSILIAVATEEADPHKREEDYAAVCCLVQNFQLLARSKPWHVHRSLPQWIYTGEQPVPLGIRPQEKIAAVLELRDGPPFPSRLSDPPAMNLTIR